MEKGLTKNQVISELSRSPHGKLIEYVPTTQEIGKQDPEFLAHLVAWNHQKSSIRDSKVALPVVSLTVLKEELRDNSLAHLALLNPRELLRAYRFAVEMKSGIGKPVEKLVKRYLDKTEKDKGWDYLALQHRKVLVSLYGMTHKRPGKDRMNQILFKHQPPAGSVFEKVAQLRNMAVGEAAGTIIEWRIPFIIAQGALGAKLKDPTLMLALIKRMTPTELITNTKIFEKWGMLSHAAVKGAYDEALAKAAESSKNVLKTTKAAEKVKDKHLKEKLRGAQDKQLKAIAVEGNWLVLCDKSGSMASEIHIAREIAGTLVKMAKGEVILIFFDTAPSAFNVTGKSLDEIKATTKYVQAGGGTSIGCGLDWTLKNQKTVDGIVIVSDAQENNVPYFANVYKQYNAFAGKEVPVYLYRTENHSNWYGDKDLKSTMQQAGFQLDEFDMEGVDYYSIPNLVATMRTNKYSLVDEIMATPLLTLDSVLQGKEELAIGA